MKFNLEAAKAYMGGLMATAGPSVSAFIIGMFESGTGIDLPSSVEGFVLTGVTFVLGYVGVYFTPNKKPA
jgi:hypothetical protein